MNDPFGNDLLIDGDDDLLDYFLGVDPEGGSTGIKNEMEPLDAMSTGMSMLSTTSKSSPMGDTLDMDFGASFDDLGDVGYPVGGHQVSNTTSQEPWSLSHGNAFGSNKPKLTSQVPKVEPSSSSTTKSIAGESNAEDDRDDDDAEKRMIKLAKNRESARQSRLRKKEQLETLEERVAVLTQELDNFRRLHLEDVNRKTHMQRLQQLNSLRDASGLTGDALRTHLETFTVTTSPGSTERMDFMEMHFKHLFNLLMPPHIKFLLWMLNEGEDVFEVENTDLEQPKKNSEVWHHLCEELNLANEQQEKLKFNFKNCDTATNTTDRHRLRTCLSYLAKLKNNMSTRTATIETHNRTLMDILTPEQYLQYLLWIEENRGHLDDCNIGELLLFDTTEPAAPPGVPYTSDLKVQQALEILKKPESEVSLRDLMGLISILDS